MFRWFSPPPPPAPRHRRNARPDYPEPNLRPPAPAPTHPTRRYRVRLPGETMVFTMYLREGLPLDPRWEVVEG